MLKITALALVAVMAATLGAGNAFAGGTMRSFPKPLGKIDQGAKMKKFLPTKQQGGQKTWRVRSVRPRQSGGH